MAPHDGGAQVVIPSDESSENMKGFYPQIAQIFLNSPDQRLFICHSEPSEESRLDPLFLVFSNL
jgi:hypothetical protein